MNIIDTSKEQGKRFNEGKPRYDLIPAFAQNEYAKVLTIGANKYGERNWEKGMSWSKIIASAERHLYAIKRGEDFDPEDNLLHAAHLMCNAAFLAEYYKIYPQGDDRSLSYLKKYRIGIDIDDVLADFIPAYCVKFNLDIPTAWNFDNLFWERYSEIINDENFWLSLKPIITPKELGFEPVVYITSRPETLRSFTERWLFINKYPSAPVIFTKEKVSVAKEYNLDVFIDDKVETFIDMNNQQILCYLFDTPQNQHIEVGHKRLTKETLKHKVCF